MPSHTLSSSIALFHGCVIPAPLYFLELIQVIVPSGIRVTIERNYWGIDVIVYAPKTDVPEKEEGLCMFKREVHHSMKTFGEQLM